MTRSPDREEKRDELADDRGGLGPPGDPPARGALHVYPLLPVPEGAAGTRQVVAAVAGS